MSGWSPSEYYQIYQDDQRCLGEDPYWPSLSTNILEKQSSMFAYSYGDQISLHNLI